MTDYRDIILRPIITEKTMKLMAEDNKIKEGQSIDLFGEAE